MPENETSDSQQDANNNSECSWQVYIVQCADKTLYTGVARDVDKRVQEHNESPRAAKYTRARRPVKLVYTENCDNQSQAQQREHVIKQLSRTEKLQLIKS